VRLRGWRSPQPHLWYRHSRRSDLVGHLLADVGDLILNSSAVPLRPFAEAMAALQIKNIPTGNGDDIKMDASYSKGATKYVVSSASTSPSFAMFVGTSAFGAYQSIGFGATTDAVYLPVAAGGDGSLHLTEWASAMTAPPRPSCARTTPRPATGHVRMHLKVRCLYGLSQSPEQPYLHYVVMPSPIVETPVVYAAGSNLGSLNCSPRTIMAQAMRAILLASATAATLIGRRSIICASQSRRVPCCRAYRITAIAPVTSSHRKYRFPCFEILPRRSLLPLE
jgi:hypothetical protein